MITVNLSSVSATNWTVNPGDSIQSVIDGAAANDNITVNDNRGNPYNYTGNLVVNKNLTLKANGTVGVNAQDPLNPVFRIDNGGSGTTIQGFILKGVTRDNQAVIYLNNANYCTITGNTIIGNYYPGAPTSTVNWGGILLSSSDYNLIHNNTVNSNRYNIRLDLGSNYNQIYHNNVNNGYHGIRITGYSSNNVIYSNNIRGNYQYGISQTNTANNGNVVHFNRIFGNVLRGIFNEGPLIDATNNWWGLYGPSTTGAVISSPYLVLNIRADPTTIVNGGISFITADLTRNSNNDDTSTLGYIMDGTMLLITTDLGTVGSNSVEKPTINGKAIATLTADEGTGTAHVSAQLDGYTTPTTADVTIMPKTVYVNTATGNNSYDGEAAVYDGTHGPKKTIQAGIDAVANSGTVYIADGSYNEHIIINKNVNLIGQSQTGTIIDGSGTGRPMYINTILTVNITNFTIQNGNVNTNDGGGIYIESGSTVNIKNSIIQQNTARFGGGIYNLGIITLNNCVLSQNIAQSYDTNAFGGAILNNGGLSLIDCILTQNSAQSTTHSGAGGAIMTGGYETVIITGCRITQNSAQGVQADGGAIFASGTVIANFNIFLDNTANIGSAIRASYGYVDARYNWWGLNEPDFSILVNGTVDYGPWLVMRYSANPTTVQQGGTSTLTADFRYDSENGFHDPANGHLPEGTSVTFTTNLGNVGSKSVVIGTMNGVATAILRGDEAVGEALTSASLDNQALTAVVIITANDEGESTTNDTSNVNAASEITKTETVRMQETGIPLPLMLLAILMVLSGFVASKRK